MDSQAKELYEDLRTIKSGKLAIFLGAGASYDYGIPTMHEMANMLMDELTKDDSDCFDRNVVRVLLGICGEKPNGDTDNREAENQHPSWNVEDLLTRLDQIKQAIGGSKDFPQVATKIGDLEISRQDVALAEEQLLRFIIDSYQLDACKRSGHGDGNIEYLAEFIEVISEFVQSIYIFTTNNDLCVEAALVSLSRHREEGTSQKFYLVDGFSHGLIPTYSIENFTVEKNRTANKISVYLWKIHGSIDWTFTNSFQKKPDKSNVFSDESTICKITSKEMCKALFKAGAIAEDISEDRSKIMIFPTPSKYSQTYTFPYMDLFESFRGILQEAQLLLAIGTSFPDRHINSAIRSFLRRDNAHLYIVDPELTNKNVKSKFGEFKTIKQVIKLGFKDFVKLLYEMERQEAIEEPGTKEK